MISDNLHFNLISKDGQIFKIKKELVQYINNIKDELIKTGSMKFDYISSDLMKKVVEYLEYRHLYISKHDCVPEFQIEESQAIDLLVIADKLGI